MPEKQYRWHLQCPACKEILMKPTEFELGEHFKTHLRKQHPKITMQVNVIATKEMADA